MVASQFLDNEYKYEDEIKNLTSKLKEVKETLRFFFFGGGGSGLTQLPVLTQSLPVIRLRAGRSLQSATTWCSRIKSTNWKVSGRPVTGPVGLFDGAGTGGGKDRGSCSVGGAKTRLWR